MDWQTVLVYLTLAAAVIAGGVLGYRRGHRALTVFLGPVLGAAVVIVGNKAVSNDSINGSGDLSWRIVFVGVGFAVVVLYLLAFAFGGAAGALRRKHAPN
ncbi:MAG: hypothetical protein ACJ76X_09855 [Solirubrobacteraceae bacterium]